jgi:hypothetical protein
VHRSATKIIRKRFFASARAVSASDGGKKIRYAAESFPQNVVSVATFASSNIFEMSDFVFNPIPPPVLPLDDDSAQEIAALLPLPLLPLPLPLDEGDEKEEKEVEHDEEAEEEVLPTRPLKEERSWCCAQDDDIFVLFKPCSSSFEELVSLGSFYLCGRFKKKKKISCMQKD